MPVRWYSPGLPLSSGATGNTIPDGFKWSQTGTANTYEVGLADNPLATGTWKNSIDGFTATNPTAAQTGRDVQVWARNSATGCIVSKNLLIQVNPSAVTISAGITNLCSGNTYADIITVTGDNSGTWAVYNEGTTTVASPVVITAADGTTGKGSLSLAAVSTLTRRDVVKINAGNCKSNTITFTVNPLPVSDDYGDFAICHGEAKNIIPTSPVTTAGPTKPDGYIWAKESGSETGIIYPAAGMYPLSLNFTGVNTTASALNGLIGITPYNAATGCTGAKQVTSITVNVGLALSVSSVCPKGTDTGNPAVVITAAYTGITKPSTFPANPWSFNNTSVYVAAPALDNTLANPTATFSGKATADGTPNAYTVTYNDGTNCVSTLSTQIDPQIILAGTVPAPFCMGAVFTATASRDNGAPVTFISDNTALATVTPTTLTQSPWETEVRGIGAGTAKIRAANKNQCKSEPLEVTVLALPILDNFTNLVLCAGQVVQPWTPLSSGATGNTIPDGFKWSQTGTANTYEVGLADNPLATGTWKNSIDGFTATNPTAAQTGRDVQVWARNSATGCTISKNLLIQVNPSALTISAGITNLCAGNTYADIITVTGDNSGTWAVYNEGTTTVASPVVITAADGTTGKGSLSLAAVTTLTRRDVVKINAGNCKSNTITFTVNPPPVSDDYGDFAICHGEAKNIIPTSPVTTAGPTKPDGYIWAKESGSETGIIYPAAGMYPLSLNFTGVNTTASALNGSIGITPYNAATGCTGAKQVTSITVNVGLALSVSSVCPKGTDTGNPAVVITAAYTGITKPSTFPANPWSFNNTSVYVAAPALDNTLANPTATFSGKATADGTPNAYTVTYNDGTNCISTLSTQIDPQIILVGTVPAPFCMGTVFTATASRDNGAPVTFISDNTALATVTPTTLTQSPWETEVRGIGAGTAKIRAANKNQCKSEPLEVTVLALPILDNFTNLVLCAGQVVQPWTPLSSGATGNTIPDGFKWSQTGTANTYEVGLADNPLATGTWKNSIDGFTATNPTAAQTGRDVQVWARNSATGCTISKNLLIQVNPSALTISAGITNLCAGNTYADIITVTGDNSGTWAVYNEGTTTVASPVVITAADGTTGKGSLSLAAVTTLTRRDVVKINAGNCKSNTITFTVNPPPVSDDYGDFAICHGEAKNIIPTSPVTTAGPTKPDGYIWAKESGSETGIIYPAAGMYPLSLNFTGVNTTASALNGSIGITPYNAATGCTGAKQVTSITVNVGLALSVSSVCPKGTDTGNPAVVITAAYTGITKPSTFPANPWSFNNTSVYVAAPALDNTLANPTATFSGKATADGTPNAYTVTYNDGTNCISTLSTQIDPQIILVGTVPAPFCMGTVFTATASRDNGAPVTFISDNTALATVTPTTLTQSPWETEVRGIGAGTAKIRAANKNQCKSEPLEVTVLALPILDNFTNLVLCAGQVVQPWTPLSSGATGNTIPDGFKWSQTGTANTYEVGLADNPLATGTWKNSIDGFTATNPTAAQTGRDVQVWARNSATGCTISKNLLIQVNPSALTISAGITNLCAGNTYADIITVTGDNSGTWAVYNEGTTTVASPVVITAADGTTGKGSLSLAAVTTLTRRDVVKISAGNCKSNTITFTVNPAPLMNDIADLETCNKAEQPAIIPASTGTITDKTIPDRFKWALATGTLNDNNVGLADHTVDWSMPAINGFTAVNATSDALTRTITVWGQNTTTMCSVSKNLNILVKPAPVISISAGSSANLCAGTYADIISVAGDNSGSWAVYNQGIATPASPVVITAANGATGKGSLNVAAVTAITKRDVVKYGSNNCKSNAITFTINPAPLMNVITNLEICANAMQAAIIPASIGTGITVPTHFQWQVLPAAIHTDDAGLPDYVTDWNKTAIDAFTAKDPASNIPAKTQLIRDVTVTPRNNTTGCIGATQTFTITVKAGLTLTVENTSPICNKTGTNILLRSSLTNTMYEWTVNAPATVTGQSPSGGTTQPLIAQTLNSTGTASETVTYSISAASGNCRTITPYTVNVVVSKDTPATPVVTGSGHFCVAAGNAIYSTNLVPGVPNYNGTVEWTYTSAPRVGTTITGNTQKATRGSLTVVIDRLVLIGISGWIDYKFRPYTTCLGNESPVIGVMVHTSPVADPPPNLAVCSGTTTNIALSSPTDAAVKYTWQVDKANGPDVSGETTISEAGAAINGIPPHKQPDMATFGPLVNTLSIPANTPAQTIDYRLKPWLAGCQGTEVRITVTVNPLPTVMAPTDINVCSGVAIPANTLTGTNFPTAFKWSGGANAGLADQAAYSAGLPGYTAATITAGITETVSIWSKNNNGCISAAAAFKITVQPIPAVTFEPAIHPKVCAGTTIDLAGSTNIAFSSTAPVKYTWSADYTPATGAKSAVEISKDNTTLAPFPTSSTTAEDGPLIKKLTASAGSQGTITVTVTPWAGTCQGVSNTIDVPVAGGNITSIVENKKPVVCSGTLAEIAVGLAGDGNTYRWTTGRSNNITGNLSGNGSGGTTIADGLTVSDKQQGWATYYITAGTADCVGATRAVTVNVDPVPVITVTPATAQTLCSGTSTAITLANDLGAQSADVSYTWTVAGNTIGATASTSPQTTFAQQVLSNTTPTDAAAIYVFTPWYHPADHPACAGLAISLPYTVQGRLKAGEITGAGRKICLGDLATLMANAQGSGTFSYQWWKDGVKIDAATGSAYPLPALLESDAAYTVSISNACQTDITSPALMVGVTADAYFTNGGAAAVALPSTLNVGDKVQFTYSGPAATYQWDFGDGTFTSAMMNPVHTYTRGETFNSWLKATKPGNAACTKTFMIPLTVNGAAYTPVTSDPNSTGFTGLKLFPIPAKDRVTIQSEGTLTSITVSDLSGKTVFSTEAAGHETTLSMGNFSSGIYILTIVDSQGVKRVKISKD